MSYGNKKGHSILNDPLLNKGTAFTLAEREHYDLIGLLPSHCETIEQQLVRISQAYHLEVDSLHKHIYLRALQDRNEVLFYRFVVDNIEETLPIIYTPVVGEACQLFYHIYRQPRGLFISYPERTYVDKTLAAVAKHRTIKAIVVTDGERILGLGDQGSGGLGIPIGKLSLYTACGGIAPEFTLPIVLDVGTNNQDRLHDPEYLGWRHPRLIGKEYDDFVDQFVQSVKRHFPHVLLQFEDFAQEHAYPLLDKYCDQLCMFNDDIQGTAAVVVATVVAATRVAQVKLTEQRIVFVGSGSAGCGIAEQLIQVMINQGLMEADARARFYMVDRNGLLTDASQDVLPFQKGLLQAKQSLQQWKLESPDVISLLDIINNAKPSILIGVSGQPHLFTETIVRNMASYTARPIIFPLSNPTDRAEAIPADLLKWTNGQALVATGSPFGPVTLNGDAMSIAQCNNTYIFPGVGLAVIAGQIKRITNRTMLAAAMALSELAPAVKTGVGALLPVISDIRLASRHIAKAVILEAIAEGHAEPMSHAEIEKAIHDTFWDPTY